MTPDITGDWNRTDETDKETGYGPLHEAMYPELYCHKKEKKIMKAISLRQPWAGLVISGVKDIENRKWSTKYRGKILIHASKQFDQRGLTLAKKWNVPQSIINGLSAYRGGIIGEVEIVDCVTSSNSKWFEGPYGFVLKNAKALPFKKCKGKLGIFDIDNSINCDTLVSDSQ